MFRVLNPEEEPQGQILSSNRKSPYRIGVFDYRKLSHDIYFFAKKTGIQIINAVRVAENIPAFLDELNAFFKSGETAFDLLQIGIDDPIKSVSSKDLYDFSYNYISDANETGLFYEFGMEHYLWEYIWEMVRNQEYPRMPARMESLFLFDKQDNAHGFLNQYRDPNYRVVEVELLDGNSQSFDMNWFSNVPSNIPMSEVEEYARNYWGQKHSENPVMEIIFQGQYMWR